MPKRTTNQSSGKKNDQGKLRYDLVPPAVLEALAGVYTLGAGKYGDYNWLGGLAWSRVYAATMRHLQAWWSGETHAEDDGQHHLAAAMWGLATLMEYERLGFSHMDDRNEMHLHKLS